jgi:hypothetical protein
MCLLMRTVVDGCENKVWHWTRVKLQKWRTKDNALKMCDLFQRRHQQNGRVLTGCQCAAPLSLSWLANQQMQVKGSNYTGSRAAAAKPIDVDTN